MALLSGCRRSFAGVGRYSQPAFLEGSSSMVYCVLGIAKDFFFLEIIST